MRRTLLLPAAVLLGLAPAAAGEDRSASPRPVPLTRPEVKKALDSLKKAKPRLPILELTEEQKKEWGDRRISYNGFFRFLYLPRELRRGRSSRGEDPALSLSRAFKTMLFWIVARTNNCYY